MSLVKRNNVMFPTFFDEVLNPDWFGGIEHKKHFVPAVNILENDKGFSLVLAVPGFKKEDFKIEVDKDVLAVSAEVKTEKESEDKTEMYSRKEFSFSSFKRLFTLPKTVNSDEINATYEAGVLTLILPKKEEALPKPKRLIAIA